MLALYILSNVLEEHTSSILRAKDGSSYLPPKCWYLHTRAFTVLEPRKLTWAIFSVYNIMGYTF
jgi:hypothetical protein